MSKLRSLIEMLPNRMQALHTLGWLVIVFRTMTGCATLHPRPFTCPEKGGSSWIEIRRPHFVLTTDLDRENADKLSAELEVMLDVLTRVGFESNKEMKARLSVVHFRNSVEYDAFAAKLSNGQVFWSGRNDFERAPLAIVKGEPRRHGSMKGLQSTTRLWSQTKMGLR